MAPNVTMDFRLVLEQVGGGVHKRIDENRELLELLQQRAPELLEECPWIETWIGGNDEVFRGLEVALQMARDDYEDRRERQRQGVELAKTAGRYTGRKPDTKVH